ncbi:MAG: Asp-tRNA(Asn)/Glu-tRNA(Gln) amidotransferase subunit GatC [bacterium]
MPKLTKIEVEHVARLAKLELTPNEITKFQGQLSKIVDYISQLSKVDTSSLEPTSQTTGLENVFRIDEIKTSGCLSQQETLSGTDKTRNGYFVVDAVLENKDL